MERLYDRAFPRVVSADEDIYSVEVKRGVFNCLETLYPN
jgi:hypothetical protein